MLALKGNLGRARGISRKDATGDLNPSGRKVGEPSTLNISNTQTAFKTPAKTSESQQQDNLQVSSQASALPPSENRPLSFTQKVASSLEPSLEPCLEPTPTSSVNVEAAKPNTVPVKYEPRNTPKTVVLSRRSNNPNEWCALNKEEALKYFAKGSHANAREAIFKKEGEIGYKGKGGNSAATKKRKFRGKNGNEIELGEFVWTKPKEVHSKRGTTGTQINLVANYFRLVTQTDWCIYQYSVDFSPEEERTMVKRKMILSFKEQLGDGYIFDGTVLFSMNRLPEAMELYCLRPKTDKCYRVTLRLVGDMAPGDHHYLQFYNLLIRRCLGHLNLQLVGRNYFDPAAAVASIRAEYRMQLWPGYITSVRQHETEVLMCAEITHKVMRRDTVLDQLTECLSRSPNDFQRIFKQIILGSIVLTEYNNKTYRVDDVDFNVTPMSRFQISEGLSITYMDYYNMRYDINIQHMHQPMLLTMPKQRDIRRGIKQPIYLVPELCRMTGLNEQMRKNFPLMKSLADQTRLGPSERIERLIQFAKRLQGEAKAKADLERWNMRLSSGLVNFNARVLGQEKIIQGGTPGKEILYQSGKNTDWTRELRTNPMLVVAKMTDWALICPTNLFREAKTFIQTVQKAAIAMGLRLPSPKEISLEDDRISNYIDAISKVCVHGMKPSIMMLILPNSRLDRYAAIKKRCCVDLAVPTQVILSKSLSSPSVMSIATKVAVQINCKIGGAPWTVEIPLEGLMVVGFDVYHDTSQRGTSIGALVASLDKPLTRYYSSVSCHRTGEELSNELSVNIIKALHKFKLYNNGKLPKKIVIYRDGVGEGQISYVFQHEVELLKQRLNEIYRDSQYCMVFIVITKRINTRFFFDGQNPPSGTIVDDVVTLPYRYDFFLVSQSVKQGTVSPTSYTIISDNLGLPPDKLQRLTYKLTHLYYNWSGTVRVPAPCQYAHKLAYLVGQAIHKSPNPDLDELLYFL